MFRWHSFVRSKTRLPYPLAPLLRTTPDTFKIPWSSPRLLIPLASTRAPDPPRGHAPLGLTEYVCHEVTSGSIRHRRKASRLGRAGHLANVQLVSWKMQGGCRALGNTRNITYILDNQWAPDAVFFDGLEPTDVTYAF